MSLTPLALSLGDPAGVGPEIVAKAWAELRESGPRFMVIGDANLLSTASRAGGAAVRRISRPSDVAPVFPNAIPVLDLPLSAPVVSGKASKAHAPHIIRWIETGAGLALSGKVSGLVTAPIAKAPLYEAGFRFPGHTEFLAELTATPGEEPRDPVMMLVAGDLRAALVTIHEPLAAVAGLLTAERITQAGLTTAAGLTRDFGIAKPRLAVAGLNPHAGEDGKIGREDIDIVAPAVAALREAGVDARGPFPADTLFHADARKGYDAVLCLYHDQALIPVKMLD
ncbi:MAG TPA: 4-hydroxythreonine-4-phosphate dehydrogenase PdxA, partial [Caulobacteraceae bacterium]